MEKKKYNEIWVLEKVKKTMCWAWGKNMMRLGVLEEVKNHVLGMGGKIKKEGKVYILILFIFCS